MLCFFRAANLLEALRQQTSDAYGAPGRFQSRDITCTDLTYLFSVFLLLCTRLSLFSTFPYLLFLRLSFI